jgi:hypothetical protein
MTAVPGSLKGVANGLIFQRQSRKTIEQCQQIVADVEQGLIGYLEGFLSHLTARLGTQSDGKLMTFQSSSVERLRAFVQNLPAMNIMNNHQLNELGQQAHHLLEGINPALQRKNRTVRELVKSELENLRPKLIP